MEVSPCPHALAFGLQDFNSVAPNERRLARYTLQLLRSVPALKKPRGDRRLKHPLVHRSDAVEYLLPLIAPLLDQDALSTRFPELHFAVALTADQAEGWQQDLDDELDLEDISRLLNRLLRQATTTLLKRLRLDDGDAPASTTAAVLGRGLGLTANETLLLDYIEQSTASETFRQLLRRTHSVNGRANQRRLTGPLGLPEPEVPSMLARTAPLRRLGLIEVCCARGLR